MGYVVCKLKKIQSSAPPNLATYFRVRKKKRKKISCCSFVWIASVFHVDMFLAFFFFKYLIPAPGSMNSALRQMHSIFINEQ